MTATTSAFTRTGPGWRYRIESLPIERLRGLAIATGLVVTSAVVHAVNLTSAPQRLAAEGDVVSRAWAAGELDALGATPYLYDHPPLGWLQISAWSWLTGAFGRAPTAVAGGREVALLAGLVAAALLWVLARRLGLARWSAAVALALFALTPLAVEHQRLALLENLAVPWILAAFVLAASPRQRLGALTASGACLGVAVLTSETALLLVPALALALWRATLPATRRVVLTLAGSALLAVCGAFVLVAAVRGQLLPGDGPNLVEGAWHQVFGRPSTGSVFDGGSATSEIVAGWLRRDPISPLLALVAAVVALWALPRLAPVAVGFLVVAAVVLRPGHVPAELVVVLLPLGALLIGGAAEHVWTWPAAAPGSAASPAGRSGQDGRAGRDGHAGRDGVPSPAATGAPRERPLGAWLLAGAALAAAVSSPAWLTHHRRLLAGDPDRPLREATAWIVDNVPADQRLIVDDAMWVDLVEAGADPDLVTGYAALDADPDLGAAGVAPWDEHDLVVTTQSLRAFPGGHPQVEAAARSSVVVAAFGSGRDRVDVRRILGEGRRPVAVTPGRGPAAAGPRPHDREAAAAAGAALARNPSLQLSDPARTALVEGEVDERVTTVLVAITAARTVLVDAFPAAAGDEAGAPRRAFEMQAATPAEAEAIAELVADQQAPYTPEDVDLDGGRRLSVTYPP